MARLPLNDLAGFAVVARTRSFTAASAELGVSPSALSHAMRGLEERLGVRLLARSTRSVAPTEAGAALLDRLTPALSEIDAGLADLAVFRDEPEGIVRITTFHWIASTFLARRLPAFLTAHPGITVQVTVDDRLQDVVADGFDAGLRFGEDVEKDMIAVRVGPPLRHLVVATPAYRSIEHDHGGCSHNVDQRNPALWIGSAPWCCFFHLSIPALEAFEENDVVRDDCRLTIWTRRVSLDRTDVDGSQFRLLQLKVGEGVLCS